MAKRSCSVDGCPYEHHARGYCSGHFQRVKHHGDPRADLPLTRPRGEYEWQRAIRKPDGEEGCWYWRSSERRGYATVIIRGQQHQAHRFVYEKLVGPIPPGLQLDHRCHNADATCTNDLDCKHRKCVNPAHLEPVTLRENVRRGHGTAGINARKTHCKRGHPFAGDNVRHVIINGRPARRCVTCTRAAKLAEYYRRKTRASLT